MGTRRCCSKPGSSCWRESSRAAGCCGVPALLVPGCLKIPKLLFEYQYCLQPQNWDHTWIFCVVARSRRLYGPRRLSPSAQCMTIKVSISVHELPSFAYLAVNFQLFQARHCAGTHSFAVLARKLIHNSKNAPRLGPWCCKGCLGATS